MDKRTQTIGKFGHSTKRRGAVRTFARNHDHGGIVVDNFRVDGRNKADNRLMGERSESHEFRMDIYQQAYFVT